MNLLACAPFTHAVCVCAYFSKYWPRAADLLGIKKIKAEKDKNARKCGIISGLNMFISNIVAQNNYVLQRE